MKIGIIGAMDAEIAYILSQLENTKETEKAGLLFTEGTIGKLRAVVVKSGVGKVNAALCTQILIDCFGITHLINSGIAGSLNNDINIGDVVVSTDAVMHDLDATAFGYEPGQVPGLAARSFKADEALRAMVREGLARTAPDLHVFEGTVATGDQFISNSAQKERIRSTFHAECTEMEGAAIAQCAYVNHIPFVIMRYISDKADESTFIAYNQFEEKASADSAKLIVSVLKHFA